MKHRNAWLMLTHFIYCETVVCTLPCTLQCTFMTHIYNKNQQKNSFTISCFMIILLKLHTVHLKMDVYMDDCLYNIMTITG